MKSLFYTLFNFLWGDLITLPLPGGGSLGLSPLVIILVATGIYFTVRTRFLPVRLFPEMLRLTREKNAGTAKGGISGLQALIVSTATRVGMGNLVCVVPAVSAGADPVAVQLLHLHRHPVLRPGQRGLPLRR